ncbi:hypothetical protein P7C70_g108, partial [Phenoliferia sp. Uapishka_3]
MPDSTTRVNPAPAHVFSSLRYDPALRTEPCNTNTIPASTPSPYLLLPYHRDRLVEAALAFKWTQAATSLDGDLGMLRFEMELDEAVRKYEEVEGGGAPLKIRVLLDSAGQLTVQLSPTPPVASTSTLFSTSQTPTTLASHPNLMPVHIDPLFTLPSVYTSNKTTSRDHYLSARSRVSIEANYAEEVLLWNGELEVMEGSITNLAFWRRGEWVTPEKESGGLPGVMRRWLLEKGAWKEGLVRRETVAKGEIVLLSNGLKGVFPGRVVQAA